MFSTSEYLELDGVGIDELVNSGEVSKGEIAEAASAQFEKTNSQINAVLQWYDPFFNRGDLDRWALGALSPHQSEATLKGVPMLRKDYGSAEAGGLVEMGSRLALGNRAVQTAPFIAKLVAAGMRISGRSAVPEFIQHGVTDSVAFGVTRNPWDLEFSAGGSSGGAAAAVAAGIVPIAHASDCAGSIRIPASACGLVGLKCGRMTIPWPGKDWDGIAGEFVVTRSVRDSRRCLDILSRSEFTPTKKQYRIGLNTQHWAGNEIDPEVKRSVEQMCELFENSGHIVEVVEVPFDYELAMSTWVSAFNSFALRDVLSLSAKTGRPIDQETIETMTYIAVRDAANLTDADRAKSWAARSEISQSFKGFSENFDVFVTPTLGRVRLPLNTLGGLCDPQEYGSLNNEYFPYNYVFNLTGWASLSVPGLAASDGHPIGVQLSAPSGAEHVLLDLAESVEETQPWPKLAPLALK